MKKQLLTILLFTTLLNAYEYSLNNGWQMVGVMEKIEDMSIFDNSCVREVWSYDSKNSIWQNYNPINKNNSTLTYLNEAVGFWTNSENSCKITSPTDISFTNIYSAKYPYLNEENISKHIEVTMGYYNRDRFYELFELYADSNYSDIDWQKEYIIFLKKGYSKDYSSINIKKIKKYEYHNKIFIETEITQNSCKSNDETLLSPLSFINKPLTGGFDFFYENIKIVDCDGNEIKDKNESFKIVDFKEISSNDFSRYISESVSEFKKFIVEQKEDETIIHLSMGNYAKNIYKMSTEVREYNDYIEVNLESNITEFGCPADELIAPKLSISIPKTDKEIIVKEYPNITFCGNL